MLIKEGFTVHAWENGKWVINSPKGRNFLVNEATHQLFQILEKYEKFEEAHLAFDKAFLANTTFEEFREYISKVIGGYGILSDDFEVKRPSMKNNYLKLKVQLINAQIAGFLAKPLTVFYSPKVFWYILGSLVLFIGAIFINAPQNIELSASQMPILIGLFYLAMPIHELGHIAACKAYNIKHGGIGFGFYFVLPVMYADVTNIWTASKEKRVIANMGGIFSGILYVSILLLVFFATKNSVFYIASSSVFVMTIWQFNPFVRFDGYWILSDITETPNLLIKSKNTLKIVFERTKNRTQFSLSKKEVWLFLYGMINTGFFIFFYGIYHL
jgi:putative peptide zinc metalloprotease protein